MDIDAFLSRLSHVTASGAGFVARCPAHEDNNASLTIGRGDDDRILINCFAGCEPKQVLSALGLNFKDLFPAKGITVSGFAEAKQIPESFLRSLGFHDIRRHGCGAVAIPYLDLEGGELAVRYRLALTGESRFAWRSGDKVFLYGLQRISEIWTAGWCLLVEGESDTVTCWHYGLPCLGVPGKRNWKNGWADHLRGVTVYIWQEPGAEDFTRRIGKDLSGARVIFAPEGLKDISEAHIAGHDIRELIERLKHLPCRLLISSGRTPALM